MKAAFSNCSHGAYYIMKVGGSIGTKSSIKNSWDKPVAELRRSPPLGRFAGSCGDGSIVARTAWELFRDFQGAAVVRLSGPGSMSLEARRVSISSHWTAGHGMSLWHLNRSSVAFEPAKNVTDSFMQTSRLCIIIICNVMPGFWSTSVLLGT